MRKEKRQRWVLSHEGHLPPNERFNIFCCAYNTSFEQYHGTPPGIYPERSIPTTLSDLVYWNLTVMPMLHGIMWKHST